MYFLSKTIEILLLGSSSLHIFVIHFSHPTGMHGGRGLWQPEILPV